ncbi:MAG TPA: flagellar biosynthetic protein FliR [Opitutaceae bacterium]|nr:flagellar biosynthetic protein FliR [Opitutaceae bacterium]
MSVDYLFAWLMILLRSVGLILQLPVIAGRTIPVTIQVALSIGLATLLAGIVPAATLPPDLWGLIGAAAMEVVIGLALGFVVRMSFGAVEMAGRIASSEIGLTATPGLGAPEPSQEPVAALLTTMAMVLFFLFGAHHAVLIAFARSFQLSPAGHAAFEPGAGLALVSASAELIELGVRIAAPFLAMNFLINLAFSVLGRAVPKMSVFVVSFSARALIGLGLLSTAGGLIARYLYVEFGDLPLRMLQLVHT